MTRVGVVRGRRHLSSFPRNAHLGSSIVAPVRFMRIPFFVSGYQVTEENMNAIAKWCEGHVIQNSDNPFVRVPVNRATNKRQTEAYIGTWVIVSVQRGERSFKVYTEEWLRKQFFEIPPEALDEEGIPDNARNESDPKKIRGIAAVPPFPAQRNVDTSGSKDLAHLARKNASSAPSST